MVSNFNELPVGSLEVIVPKLEVLRGITECIKRDHVTEFRQMRNFPPLQKMCIKAASILLKFGVQQDWDAIQEPFCDDSILVTFQNYEETSLLGMTDEEMAALEEIISEPDFDPDNVKTPQMCRFLSTWACTAYAIAREIKRVRDG